MPDRRKGLIKERLLQLTKSEKVFFAQFQKR